MSKVVNPLGSASDPILSSVQPAPSHGVLRWGIFESIGIFAVSVSGHSSLPVLRNSMKRPQVIIPPGILLD